jgi:putative ABC transport system permease protein
MAMTDLTIVTRSLKARLFSTATTVLLVGVAVGLMLVLLSMRDSGRRAFERGTGNMHILVSADSSPLVSVLNSVFYANAPARALPWDKYLQIAADPRLDFAVPVQQGDSFRGFPTMGTVPEFFTRFQPERGEPFALAEGKFLEQTFDVVLGAEAAGATGLKVGDQLYITHGITRRGHAPVAGDRPGAGPPRDAGHAHAHEAGHTQDQGAKSAAGDKPASAGAPAVESAEDSGDDIHDEFPFTVRGVLQPTGSAHDRAVFITLDASWVVHADERRHQAAEASGKAVEEPTPGNLRPEEKLITGIYIGVKGRAGSDLPPLVPVVFNELRRDVSLTVALPGQQILTLFQIVGNIDRILLGIAGVVMVSSSLAIMLALYNSMNERRRQIAVLRVLGASRGRIFGLILTESAVIGLVGAAAGVAIAVLALQVVSAIMKARLGLVIEPAMPLLPVMVVASGAVLLACAAGMIPAFMGYRTSVARSLRPVA